jgi:hypothetical protein
MPVFDKPDPCHYSWIAPDLSLRVAWSHGGGRSSRTPIARAEADQSPPKSLAEMQAVAAVADRVLHLPGRLGTHEELGRELAAMLG